MTETATPRWGILLSNLGTPDAPTPAALRRYLGEFLWDRRVVDLPRPLWWLILHGVILRIRPRRSAAAYAGIWSAAGSPLLAITRQQQRALQAELERRGVAAPVALGMRYGNPPIASALAELEAQGVEQIVVLPLYPQFSSSTTASTFDAVLDAYRDKRAIPALHLLRDYHDHPGYLDALAASIGDAWAGNGPPERLIFSFHGTPQRFRDEGDPYAYQCERTAAAVAERLGLQPEQWELAYQSRFGREAWLRPYLDERLTALPAEGVRSVDVVCPGFSADCLETLEEIAEENRERFLSAGGERYRYIPALNDRPDHIAALADLVLAKRDIGGSRGDARAAATADGKNS